MRARVHERPELQRGGHAERSRHREGELGLRQEYQLTGKVVDGSVPDTSGGVDFKVRDRDGSTAVPVSYSGAVPDPFREGREVIVTVRKEGATFVGERDSLVTKCPSKFTEDATPS